MHQKSTKNDKTPTFGFVPGKSKPCILAWVKRWGEFHEVVPFFHTPRYQNNTRIKLQTFWSFFPEENGHHNIDPRARGQIYASAWRSSKVRRRPEVHLETVIEALTSRLVAAASVFYWMDGPTSTLTPAQVNWLSLASN